MQKQARRESNSTQQSVKQQTSKSSPTKKRAVTSGGARPSFYTQTDPRFYKESSSHLKNMKHNKTSYNFMDHNQEPQPARVNQQVANARFTGSAQQKHLSRYEDRADVLAGSSPRKTNHAKSQFAQSVSNDADFKINQTGRPLSPQKTRDLVGRNRVAPGDKKEMQSYNVRHGSPEKHSRVEGIHKSQGMASCIAHTTCSTDPFSGSVSVKATNHSIFTGRDMKKDVWKPKCSLQWHEPYRAGLTLQ